MADRIRVSDLTDPEAVRTAMEQFDLLGREAVLRNGIKISYRRQWSMTLAPARLLTIALFDDVGVVGGDDVLDSWERPPGVLAGRP